MIENEMNKTTNNHRHKIEPLKFLVFSASLRKPSFNTRLARLAASILQTKGVVVEFADMEEFDCPSFNQDVEEQKIISKGAEQLRKRLNDNDAFVIASPEYNASMPGLLKNAIDCVSRFRPQPFNGKHGLLMSASPSMAGGNRGLWSLRMPLEHLGAPIFPDMFSLAMAHEAFNDDGTLVNPVLEKRFEENLASFILLVEAAKNYHCIKNAWVEFLGEKPDPVTERVE